MGEIIPQKPSAPKASRWRALWTHFYFQLLPHSRPDDLCVLVFAVTVAVLFLAVDQPFNWLIFWEFTRPLFYWMIPVLPVVLMQERYRLTHRLILGTARFLRDFMPYLICLVIYLNLADVVYLVSPVNQDPTLIAIDQALFGVQVSQWLERFSQPWLDEWMHFTYEIFGLYPVTLGLFLMVRGQRRAFRDLLLAIILASYVGYLGYITVPAIGPRYYLEYAVDLRGRFFASVEWAMKNQLYIPRDCFPSLHTANTLVVLGMAFRHRRGLFWFYLPLCLSTVLATMYLRYHYAIDVLAGTLLAAVVLWVAPRWNERWDAWTARIRARGTVA